MRSQRLHASSSHAATDATAPSHSTLDLLLLPEAALELVLSHLDATSLARLTASCKSLCHRELVHETIISPTRTTTSTNKQLLSKPEVAALQLIHRRCWGNEIIANRWHHERVLTRLLIEESACGFDWTQALANGFVLHQGATHGATTAMSVLLAMLVVLK